MESGRNSQRKDSDEPANSEGKGAEARRGRVAVGVGGMGPFGIRVFAVLLREC